MLTPQHTNKAPLTRADLMQQPGFADLEADSAGNPCVWLNCYQCDCGNDWDDAWSCRCDDECSTCGKDYSPVDSDWLGPIDADTLALWERLPEAGSPEGDLATQNASAKRAMPPSQKPQCNAARAYIEALHAEKRGEITASQLNAAGAYLNAQIAQHGIP